ncbi:MAG TPA: I78 family peptidase inhibitor [Rhizomicrobium sp.]|nr:I78 family peptidase inhibitor [Rhizomicrobium sp.]
MRHAAIAAAMLVFAACASRADGGNPTTVDGLKGYTLRVIHPGEMVSMIYMKNRVTVTVDKDNRITNVAFY